MKRSIVYAGQTDFIKEVTNYLKANPNKRVYVLMHTNPSSEDKLKSQIEEACLENNINPPMIGYIPTIPTSPNISFFNQLKRILSAMDAIILVGSIQYLDKLDHNCQLLDTLDIHVITDSWLYLYETTELLSYRSIVSDANETTVNNREQKKQAFTTPDMLIDKLSTDPNRHRVADAIKANYQKLEDAGNKPPYTEELHEIIKSACYISLGSLPKPYSESIIEYLELWYATGYLDITFTQLNLLRKAINQL